MHFFAIPLYHISRTGNKTHDYSTEYFSTSLKLLFQTLIGGTKPVVLENLILNMEVNNKIFLQIPEKQYSGE